MKAVITLIRWKNLVITAFYQSILYFMLILPAFKMAGMQPQLDLPLIILFILCTICIAASANIINDILDVETDQINKPSSPLVSGQISGKTAWMIYLSMLTGGFIMALYVAWKIEKIHLTVIYIGMQALMYYYSRTFKKTGLPGNIIVAISIAFVSLIMLWSEPEIIQSNNLQGVKIIITGFSVFVFFINLARELVKDIEDMEGDKSSGLSTLPINSGIKVTKWLASVSLFILVICLVFWTFTNKTLDFRMQVFPLVILGGPLILSIFRIYKADIKIHFTRISKLLKYIMLLGLLYLLLIIQNNYH